MTAVTHHRTDLILRKVNLDRYDDRDFVDVNLVDSYDHIIAFIQKHLPDPFYLEGDTRISLRDIIFREIASNILIHREYKNAFPAKLIIEYGQVRTENSNNAHGFGLLNPANFTPFPKNPVISAFFRQIGRADELGSGMRKLMKYGKAYGKEKPQLIEGDIFNIVVKIPEFNEASGNTPQVTPQVETLVGSMDEEMTRKEMMERLRLKDRVYFLRAFIEPALKLEFIAMTDPDKPTSPKQKYRLTEKGREYARESWKKKIEK